MIEFSIILTSYNRKKLLYQAVQSVLDQTYPHFELIIVDDHSDVENRFEPDKFPSDRIRFFCQAANKGVSAARNKGIELTRHPYIVFLDDDDVFHKRYLEKMADHIKQYPNLHFAWCSKTNKVYENDTLIEKTDHIFKANSFTGTDECPMLTYWANSIGVMIKKNVFNQIGMFDTELSTAEDLDLLLRMLDAGFDYVSIPEILIDVNIYNSESSLSRLTSSNTEAENLLRMIQRNFPFLSKHPNVWGYYMKSLIFSLYRAKRQQEARRHLIDLIKHKPGKWHLLFRALRYEFS